MSQSGYYSQFEEDKFIVENIIRSKSDGFFIEIGCAEDGVINSNTKYFEDIGWHGFLIEADPSAICDIQKHRKSPVLNYAITNQDHMFIDFFVQEDKGYSGTLRPSNKKFLVKSISLYSLLKNLGCNTHIDLLSIDTEGTELDVLDGLNDIRPSIMIVEYNTAFVKNDIKEVWNKLEALNYEIKHKTKCNLIACYLK